MQTPVYSIIIGVLQLPIPARTTAREEAACAVETGCLNTCKRHVLYCTTIVFIENEYLYMY